MNIIERAEAAWNAKADGDNQWHELDIEEKLEVVAEEIKKLGPEFRRREGDYALEGYEGLEQFISILLGEEEQPENSLSEVLREYHDKKNPHFSGS